MHQAKDIRLAGWIQKKGSYTCYLQETHLRSRDTYRLKVRGQEKVFHTNGNDKKDGAAILISDKINFKTKTVIRDREGHYIMIKDSIQEERTTIINIYIPNTGAPQCARQILTNIKGKIGSNTVLVGELILYFHQWRDHLDRKLMRKQRP